MKKMPHLILGASLALLSFALPVSSQVITDQNNRGVVETVKNVNIHWSEGVIRVTGAGAPPDRGNMAQKRLMAERAALADAYRKLTEVVHGIRVNSETIVRDYVVESDVIKTKVEGLIHGVQKLDQRYMSDGSVEVDVVLKLNGQNGLGSILQPQKNHNPPPPAKEIKPQTAEEAYTGVIIDCRGLNVKPAMSPSILAQSGGELYIGNLEVDPDFVINHGIVTYSRTLMEARLQKRAGKNPLIIKAVSGSGTFRTDAIVEDTDAEILLGLQKDLKLLQLAKVIFVL